MAGFSDAPMREMVSEFGVDAVVSEMIASKELQTGKAGVKERALCGNLKSGTRYIVQIAGRDPKLMAQTAQFAQRCGAEQIDINMGCPAKKVVSGATAGASLLLEPRLACEIIEATAHAVNLPVSVKTRLGWDQHSTKNIITDFENAGAQIFTIHGRTRQQKYQGHANWRAVAEIKSRANVPVIVNGDINSTNTARQALAQSGADGVMIGRAAVGAPALPSQIRAELSGQAAPRSAAPILKHYQKILNHYGEEMGVLCARKHLKAYFQNAPKSWMQNILASQNPCDVMRQLEDGYV